MLHSSDRANCSRIKSVKKAAERHDERRCEILWWIAGRSEPLLPSCGIEDGRHDGMMYELIQMLANEAVKTANLGPPRGISVYLIF